VSNSRKRIVMLCTRHSAFDGRVFQLEARALRDAGHQVTIIAPRLANEPGDSMVEGIRVLTFPKLKNMFLRKLHTLYSITRYALSVPADVYHVHEVDAALMGGAYAKWRQRRVGRDVKLLFDSHEVWPYFYATFRKNKLLRRVIVHLMTEYEHYFVRNHVDVVVAAHELETNYYLWQDPWTPAHCVIGAPPIESWGKPPSRKGKIRVIGHDGFFTLQRGMDKMLGAFELLAPDYPDLTFLAAGDFMQPADKIWFEQWCERTGLGDRVEWTGWVDRGDVLNHLDRMDIGLVANQQDIHSVRCWPANKMMYYLGRGLPVVSTPAPLYRRYIEAKECGRVADAFSSQAMADALRDLLDHPSETRTMGKRGYEAALNDFSSEGAIRNLKAAYADLDRMIERGDESITLGGR